MIKTLFFLIYSGPIFWGKVRSKLVLASFSQENGKTIAMIDHKNVPVEIDRKDLQKKWREVLDNIFAKE